MSEQHEKPYDWLVTSWMDEQRKPYGRTAYLRPDDVLHAPIAALTAIRALISDGHRVVIGRKKQEGTQE